MIEAIKNKYKKKIKKKIALWLLGGGSGSIVLFVVILVACLLTIGFFGENYISGADDGDGITDPYIEENAQYVDAYLPVVTKYLNNKDGYVSLSRIVYFYQENNKLTFEEIYEDNLDKELKQVKPISIVCEMEKYKKYDGCRSYNIETSKQINQVQNKPFNAPIDFSKIGVTSFFMQQRIVYGNANVHKAWDLSSPDKTPVYSVCDGIVTSKSFTYNANTINVNDKVGGNNIYIECNIEDSKYQIFYAHLYPNSDLVSIGDKVEKGQEIASVGTTGYSTGSHLHFQVKRNEKYVDGMSLIKIE